MTNAQEAYEDDYNEYEEFDDEDERGLSGFAVLVIGLVMIGAFISVVWVAYQQGLRRNPDVVAANAPYVAAEPEPIKIESADEGSPAENREVYDVLDGEAEEPATVLAEGPEEPIDRAAEDPIGEIASHSDVTADDVAGAPENRIAQLQDDDANAIDEAPAPVEPAADEPAPEAPTVLEEPAPDAPAPQAPATPTRASLPTSNAPAGALSGTHVVQVGAFRSDAEAQAYWSRMQTNLGDYLAGKSSDIERADKGADGVYHRLRVGPFPSSDAARQYCAGLKERGQNCLSKSL